MKNLHAFTSHRRTTRRYFATYRIKGDDRRTIEGHVEVAFRPKLGKGGFRFHLGNRGSETPVDGMVDLGRVAVFWGVNAPSLGRLCEWVGRGHKRDLSLQIHGGSLWWKGWYDDDGGMDPYHRCDSWRQPKVWPWSRGRRKHRGWMCLRDGNIDLNPLDAFWGSRYFEYEDVEKVNALVPVNEFPGDEYLVDFTLQKQTRARRFGPSWARHRSDEGWVAAWECRPGIPVRNHSWKGDNILASGVPVSGVDGWLAQAVEALVASVKRDRRHYRYNPPVPSSENGFPPGEVT